MIVELAGSPANQVPPVSDSFTVDADLLPVVLVFGAIAGIWVFFKVLELVRKLFVPLLVAAVVVLLGQGVNWSAIGDLLHVADAGASQQGGQIPPLKEFLPK